MCLFRNVAILVVVLTSSGAANAHGGRLDANGCHTNRQTGDSHCHRSTDAVPPRTNNGLAPSSHTTASLSPTTKPFANCAEARAAGAAPVRRGDPGYGLHLDRDNDGVGCEPYKKHR